MSTYFFSRHASCRKHSQFSAWVALFLFAFSVSGCHRDPNVRKQKFLEQGDRDYDKGEYASALISYGRAVQVDPRFPDAHYKLALTHLKMASWAFAYQELRRTLDLQPDNWDAQLRLGQIELAGGKRQEAKDRALLILKNNPAHVEAQTLLSQADTTLGNLPLALQEANEALTMAPDRPASYLNLGQIQIRGGHPEQAELNFQKAQSLDPKGLSSYMTLGNFYQQQKRWMEAEKQFQQAVQVAPSDPLPRAALASLYFSQGQAAHAEQVLTDAKNQLSSVPSAYRMLGDSYLARGDKAKAVAEFGELVLKYPNDLGVLRTYVQLLILNNRWDEAQKLDEELLKKSPQDAEALILKAQMQLRDKKPEQAIPTLQGALKSSPDNAFGHYQLGLAYQEKADLQQAEKEWREAVRLRPSLSEAWLALSASASQRGDWKALEETSNELKKHAPNSVDAYLNHATARLNLGDPLGAEADLVHVRQQMPKSALPYIKLGELRMIQHRAPEGEALFRQALGIDPDSVEATHGLVQVFLAKNKPADALKFVDDQLARSPGNSALYVLQGELLLQLKQSDQAMSSLARALELDNKNLNALVLLAQLQARAGKQDQAIANYQRALEFAPNDVRLYVLLGTAYESMGNWQQAQSTYQKALTIQPDHPLASNNLAYLLLEHGGSPTVALTLAQVARKGLPNLPNSADTLGWAYYNNAAYSVATPLFEEAIKKGPDNQTYRYHLAMNYRKLNDLTRARTELGKVISLNPTSPIAELARQALSEISGS